MNLRLHIATSPAHPLLSRLKLGLSDRVALHRAIGLRVQKLTVDHLQEYDATHPNQLGAPRSHYWLHAAFDASLPQNLKVTASAAVLSLNTPGINRALHPVTIEPINAKNLAIPNDEQACHLRPREVPGLAPMFRAGRCMGLIDGEQRIRQRDTKHGQKGTPCLAERPGGLVWYWFAKSVNQPQDPDLLPTKAEFAETTRAAAHDFVNKLLGKL